MYFFSLFRSPSPHIGGLRPELVKTSDGDLIIKSVLSAQGKIHEPLSLSKQKELKEKYQKNPKFKDFQIGSLVLRQTPPPNVPEKSWAIKVSLIFVPHINAKKIAY